jgi:hypothetical protein
MIQIPLPRIENRLEQECKKSKKSKPSLLIKREKLKKLRPKLQLKSKESGMNKKPLIKKLDKLKLTGSMKKLSMQKKLTIKESKNTMMLRMKLRSTENFLLWLKKPKMPT